ncbi:MAG TPA: amidase domain-containing protein [Bacillaceae bacterium]|nr:amidase domain-containing protein [Bacillaceae bacterium]
MREQLLAKLDERIEQIVRRRKVNDEKIIKKLDSCMKRKADIVKVLAEGQINSLDEDGEHVYLHYDVRLKYLIRQCGKMYIEEEVENRKASFYKGSLYEEVEVPVPTSQQPLDLFIDTDSSLERAPFYYDRLKAVQYAERWWNEYNPAYEKFENDCTNYISQCLRAGGSPMRGYPNRSNGWWYQNKNWSYSWSVANALKIYLGSSKTGLRAREVHDPLELKLGDVICYDFQGDGRFDHNTIVTGKDYNGEPLVNAHTYNSRMRYWAYEDSTAYTPNIKYKMYSIVDDA